MNTTDNIDPALAVPAPALNPAQPDAPASGPPAEPPTPTPTPTPATAALDTRPAPLPGAASEAPGVSESATPPNAAPQLLTPETQASTAQGAVGVSSVLARLRPLSAEEQQNYFACESTIRMGFATVADIGVALSVIRDQELYRMEFDSFEQYCRERWQYARRYVFYLIAAAQVFRSLCTNCAPPRPEHESQIRPLIGLEPEQAKRAWELAVGKAGGGKITARLVEAAVSEIQGKPDSPPPRPARRNKNAVRRLIEDAIGELLHLVSQHAEYPLLTQKIENLHGHFRGLFA